MSEGRFERWNDCSCKVKDNQKDIVLNWKDVVHKLNKQQATINKLEQENRQLRQFINKGRRLSVKELMANTNEKELLKKKIKELEKENKDLREVNKETVKQCERWKNLYELKDAEVTARITTLNKVCEYYTSEVLFKSDVDPNKAVKEVINEILNTEVEM